MTLISKCCNHLFYRRESEDAEWWNTNSKWGCGICFPGCWSPELAIAASSLRSPASVSAYLGHRSIKPGITIFCIIFVALIEWAFTFLSRPSCNEFNSAGWRATIGDGFQIPPVQTVLSSRDPCAVRCKVTTKWLSQMEGNKQLPEAGSSWHWAGSEGYASSCRHLGYLGWSPPSQGLSLTQLVLRLSWCLDSGRAFLGGPIVVGGAGRRRPNLHKSPFLYSGIVCKSSCIYIPNLCLIRWYWKRCSCYVFNF